jgi:putative sigma-54 modulation protein
MKLEITGRHVAVTSALKTFTEEKLAKLGKWIDDLAEIHVVLTVEKHRHIAEIIAHGNHLKLSAREVTADMYTSIGECLEKLERQAKKQKEKHTTKRRRSPAPESLAAPEPGPEPPRRARRRRARPAVGARASRLDGDGLPRIVRSQTFSKKPMSVEEAALQVSQSDIEFVVFRNERSEEVNVLYRRKDGSLGLIEPER